MNLPQDGSFKPLASQPVSYQEPQLPDLLAWAHLNHSLRKEGNNPLGVPKPTFMEFQSSIQTGRDMALRGRLGMISRSRDRPELSVSVSPLSSCPHSPFPP